MYTGDIGYKSIPSRKAEKRLAQPCESFGRLRCARVVTETYSVFSYSFVSAPYLEVGPPWPY